MYNNQNLIGKKVLIPDFINTEIERATSIDYKKYKNFRKYISENNFPLIEAEIHGETTIRESEGIFSGLYLHQFILKVKNNNKCVIVFPREIMEFVD